jgi:hypothetical protein
MALADLEVTGNAFWEVLRDGKGDLARLVYVPSYTVRLQLIVGSSLFWTSGRIRFRRGAEEDQKD